MRKAIFFLFSNVQHVHILILLMLITLIMSNPHYLLLGLFYLFGKFTKFCKFSGTQHTCTLTQVYYNSSCQRSTNKSEIEMLISSPYLSRLASGSAQFWVLRYQDIPEMQLGWSWKGAAEESLELQKDLSHGDCIAGGKAWAPCLRSSQGLQFITETKDKATAVKRLEGVFPSKFKADARSHFGRVPSALFLELWTFSQPNTEVKQCHYKSSYPKNSDWEGSLAYSLAYFLGQDQI